jgi:hypothetical protein
LFTDFVASPEPPTTHLAYKQQEVITGVAIFNQEKMPDATSSNTDTPAQTAVLTTAELLETILSNLRAPDILLATAVSKEWRTAIERSPKIRNQLATTRYDDVGSHDELHCFDISYDTFIIRELQELRIIYALINRGGRTSMNLVDGKKRSLTFTAVTAITIHVKFEDRELGYAQGGPLMFQHKPTRDYIKLNLMSAAIREEHLKVLEKEKKVARRNKMVREKLDVRRRWVPTPGGNGSQGLYVYF